MEHHAKAQETISSSSSGHSCTNGTAAAAGVAAQPSSSPPAPPPLTPKSMPKACEANPYPTTFVQADTSSFKQVVQMLTGSAETAAAAAAAGSGAHKAPAAPAAKATGPKKPAFKLYERRNSLKNLKVLSPLMPTFLSSSSNSNSPVAASAGFSPRNKSEILSPSMLDFPSLVLSPVTPLIPDPFNRPPHPNSEAAKWAEDRAIAEKGFYLHPSPRAPADAEPPRLLPLFPVTSAKFLSSDLSLATPQSST